MKLLLTSAGIKNTSIHDALVDLLGKPIAESNALCIPTASYAHPWPVLAGMAFHQRAGAPRPMSSWAGSPWACWSSPRCPASTKNSGSHWSRKPTFCWSRRRRLVSVPLDAAVGTGRPHAVAARHGLGGIERREHGDDPRIGEDFVQWRPPTGDDSTLGIVDFSIFPHLAHDGMPGNSMAEAERWAAEIAGPAYAIDDETAIKVVDGTVEVVSEGHWKLFTPAP